MGLKDYFRRYPEQTTPTALSGKFWSDVELLCAGHVPKTLEFFRSHNAPRMDWAAPLFMQLVNSEALQSLMNVAKTRLGQARQDRIDPPSPVGAFGSWFVCVTVFPSASDADFLNACPKHSFENYIEECQNAFHAADPSWPELHYAQWILLLREDDSAASIHLYTQWSFSVRIKWIVESQDNLVVEAPIIVPTELLKDSIHDLHRRLLSLDFEASERCITAIIKEVATFLFMDSVVSETPTEPSDPVNYKTSDGTPCDLIVEAIELHRKDCKDAGLDIPLILAVPARFSKAVEEHLQSIGYVGLSPQCIQVCSESELPFLDANGNIRKRGKYEIETYLAGGGYCLTKIVEQGLLSRLWKQGIRWLVLGQIGNRGARINANLLEKLAACKSDGLFEVVERTVEPRSKLVLLMNDGLPICVDDRRLRSSEHDQLRNSPYVGTGTFWVRCEKLAQAFGIKIETLQSEWNQEEWKGKLSADLLNQHAIVSKSAESGLGIFVPVWEVLSSLQFEAIHVDSNRIDLR
jgi:hypothetical protein